MKNEELDKLRLAAWNTAFGAVNRLNALFDQCVISATELNSFAWYMALKQIDKELDCKMNDEQRELVKKKFLLLRNKIVNKNNPQAIRNQREQITVELYDDLDELEKTLRSIADKAGLLVPTKTSIFDTYGEGDD